MSISLVVLACTATGGAAYDLAVLTAGEGEDCEAKGLRGGALVDMLVGPPATKWRHTLSSLIRRMLNQCDDTSQDALGMTASKSPLGNPREYGSEERRTVSTTTATESSILSSSQSRPDNQE